VPPSFSTGIPFSFESIVADHYVFVREADFLAPQIHRSAVPRDRASAILSDTSIVPDTLRIENDVVVNRGPDVRRVEQIARAPVARAPIEHVPRLAPVERVTVDALRVEPDQIDRGQVRATSPMWPSSVTPGSRASAPRDRRAADSDRSAR
jgi:hypothetical protein